MGNGQTDPVIQVELTGLANGWEAGVRGRQETKGFPRTRQLSNVKEGAAFQ